MSALAALGLLLKSFGNWTDSLRRQLVSNPVLAVSHEARRPLQWKAGHRGPNRVDDHMTGPWPQSAWPARHPAEMALLARQQRAHDHHACRLDRRP